VSVSADATNSADADRPFDSSPIDEGDYEFDASGIRATVPPKGTFKTAKPIDKELDEEFQKPPRFEEKPPPSDKAKAGPPNLDEWEDFFSRIVLLTILEWYVSWCFRGIPEEVISEEDLQRCVLSREDRKIIAQPMAELANKSSFARKRGRQVLAMAESAEAVIVLGMHLSKIHRIAGKYKPKKVKPSERVQPNQATGNGTGPVFDPNVTVWNPGTG
jgi:hypothetical protein